MSLFEEYNIIQPLFLFGGFGVFIVKHILYCLFLGFLNSLCWPGFNRAPRWWKAPVSFLQEFREKAEEIGFVKYR